MRRHLKTITVKGFKSIGTPARFDVHGLNMLIDRTGAGKSNFVQMENAVLKTLKGTNMKSDIIGIIDRSGSMNSIVNDAIGGFNTFLEAQQKIPGEATLTFVQFDTIYVNGGNNFPNLRQDDESWKIRLIEAAFMQRMWDTGGNA